MRVTALVMVLALAGGSVAAEESALQLAAQPENTPAAESNTAEAKAAPPAPPPGEAQLRAAYPPRSAEMEALARALYLIAAGGGRPFPTIPR